MAVEAAGCLDGFELRTGLIRRLLMWGRQAGDGESVTSGSGRDPCLVAGTRPCPGRYSAGSAWPGRGPFEPQNPANPAECRVSLQCLAAASDPTPAGRSRTFFADPSARASRPSRPYRQMAETSKALTVGLLYNRLLTEFLISARKILTLLIYYGHCLRVYLLLSVKDLRRERFAILSPNMVYILSQCSQIMMAANCLFTGPPTDSIGIFHNDLKSIIKIAMARYLPHQNEIELFARVQYAQESSSCGCDSRRSASLGIERPTAWPKRSSTVSASDFRAMPWMSNRCLAGSKSRAPAWLRS